MKISLFEFQGTTYSYSELAKTNLKKWVRMVIGVKAMKVYSEFAKMESWQIQSTPSLLYSNDHSYPEWEHLIGSY